MNKRIITITKENAKEITELLRDLFADSNKGCRFVGFTYESKSGYVKPEVSKFSVALHVNKNRLAMESLEIAKSIKVNGEIEEKAKTEIIKSLENTLAKGVGNNSNYTRKGSYSTDKGIRSNDNGNLEINCLQLSRKVISEGERKTVNSRPLTIAKNAIRKVLPYSRLRSFTIDPLKFSRVAIDGERVELS